MGHIVLASGTIVCVVGNARAQDAERSVAELSPAMSLDLGLGYAQPTLARASFGNVGSTAVTGATLGLLHPSGFLFYGTLHLYPFHVRSIGIATVTEVVSLSPDGQVSPLVASNVDYSNNAPSYFSVLVGPEAQARVSSFLFRGSVLGGMRITTAGNFTAYEWRVGTHAQIDYVWGDEPHGMGMSLGVLGGVDMFPSLGFSVGGSFSLAMF